MASFYQNSVQLHLAVRCGFSFKQLIRKLDIEKDDKVKERKDN